MVDPLDHAVDFYMQEAEQAGLNIHYVIDTHVHADHISGARELAERTGAKLALYAETPAEYAFTPLADGERIDLGNVVIDVVHTPGHTPEHISLIVTDHRRGPEPWFVLTGHTFMIGDVGRPDLVVEDGAQDLYHSIFDKMLSLPDYLEVYPGAFSGST
ncbi:MBL fold metallo-hydrolase [Fodinisporobacter ferrooxydans]|uniref:MBL fold metallo-hydrolase n=1 Tax=Fodinisporobacter ferrooxydans TaxID=2901836 RepID=A0ABY4CSN4_9BACL|nr:MBL fold metallo-hydrolase [Alicyclobacillaceae bacterium MYW30-H2]